MTHQPVSDGTPLAPLKLANLAVSFLLELCALAAFAYWGFQVGPNLFVKFLLGLGTPILVGVVWGIFIAPRAYITLPRPLNLTLRLIVFGLAALSLAAVSLTTLAWLLAIVVIVNYALVIIWKQ
jgi:Protein of unknown function (DUF2568)